MEVCKVTHELPASQTERPTFIESEWWKSPLPDPRTGTAAHEARRGRKNL